MHGLAQGQIWQDGCGMPVERWGNGSFDTYTVFEVKISLVLEEILSVYG